MPHRIGLLLMILALGSCVDLRSPTGDGRQKAEHYYSLARAALCEIPLMDDTSFDAVQALVSESVIYTGYSAFRFFRI
jgi:hypothetical protein